jgi:hypothetical protein
MAERTQYGLYYAKFGTDERHHSSKGWHESDLRRLASDARWILENMREQRGHQWRLHGGWSTGLEIWEFPYGDHPEFTPPDRRLAYACWGDEDITLEACADPELFKEDRGGVR